MDGSVVAWGNPRAGGDLQPVADLLTNVCELHATCAAFAAVTDSGEIVSWGSADHGGDSALVRTALLE